MNALSETVDTVNAIMEYSQHYCKPLTWLESYLIYRNNKPQSKKPVKQEKEDDLSRLEKGANERVNLQIVVIDNT